METRSELLGKLMREMLRCFRTLAPRHLEKDAHERLTHAHMGLLYHLKSSPEGLSVKDLAAKLCVTSGAVTQFIDELVEKGFVVREEDTQDKRVLRVKLSKKIHEKMEKFMENYLKQIEPKFENFSEQEIKSLVKLLEKINSR